MPFPTEPVVDPVEPGDPSLMAEPLIYLYPTRTRDVLVRLSPVVTIVAAAPALHDGWHVRASPSGRLVDLATGEEWRWLFWEGYSDVVPPPDEGVVLARGE